MANNKPPLGKRFEKGNKANPLGAAAHNKEVKMIRRLTNEEIAEIGTIILDGTPDALREIMNNKASSALKVAICSVLLKAISKGDMAAISALLDRIVGRVKEQVQVDGKSEIRVIIEDFISRKRQEVIDE